MIMQLNMNNWMRYNESSTILYIAGCALKTAGGSTNISSSDGMALSSAMRTPRTRVNWQGNGIDVCPKTSKTHWVWPALIQFFRQIHKFDLCKETVWKLLWNLWSYFIPIFPKFRTHLKENPISETFRGAISERKTGEGSEGQPAANLEGFRMIPRICTPKGLEKCWKKL